MRLWSEYLYSRGLKKRIKLKLESGKLNPYKISNRASLDRYLKYQFVYASSWTLKRDLKRVKLRHARPGDVIVQRKAGSSLGHVYVIVDVAKNSKGQIKVVLAQSNIPAQSFHILENNPIPYVGWDSYKDEFTGKKRANKWFDLKKFLAHTKKDEDFGKGLLRRFR